MLTQKGEKYPHTYCCNECDYNTMRKHSFEKHLLTPKHLKLTNVNCLLTQKSEKVAQKYFCEICNKEYKSRVGIWKHNKKCNKSNNNSNNDSNNELIKLFMEQNLKLMEQNKDFKNTILEVCKNINPNAINSYNNNSNNKTFNLQIFLNETCKDAMNIMDFVDSLQIQLSDLENMGKLGYVGGMSNIIIKNLNALDVEKRPVHCSDSKREVIYVKDQNKWEKENDDRDNLKNAIKHIAHKNLKLIPQWKATHPDCIESQSKFSNTYQKIILETMGGDAKIETSINENKIIKNIVKEVVIEK